MKKALLCLVAAALALPVVLAQNDSETQAAVQRALTASRFKGVQANVRGGVVTLTGTVDLLDTKLNADSKVRHVHGIRALRDTIQVNAPEISDQQLQGKLEKTIAYRLLGYVPVEFQAITVEVHDGVVTLGGHAAGGIAVSESITAVENTKGVKDLIVRTQVDPASNIDDGIRAAEFRAIYGYPLLNQFVTDPLKPIRIQVANGHVTLYGTVDTQSERDGAGIQANTVPGVFSVTNDLVVANAASERPARN
jgi:osmotically-inducible protein OsmY